MDPYATHQPALVRALWETGKRYPDLPILECGCGDYSTLLIKELKNDRDHVVMSADPEWYERYSDDVEGMIHVGLQGANHWEDVEFTGEYGLCLMDSEELVAHRVKRVPALLEIAKIVVMHDAHEVPKAKFHCLHTRLSPPTWIGSNEIDVSGWFR